MRLPKELYGCLWHTTKPDRYEQIRKDSYILPNPNIPDTERWKANRGPEFYPFVRKIGGVSLFDFKDFDEIKYNEEYPLSGWQTFVPYLKKWGAAIWIEIDRDMISDNFKSGEELLREWRETKSFKHTLMPIIEAAHIGPIPIKAFRRVLIYSIDNPVFREI